MKSGRITEYLNHSTNDGDLTDNEVEGDFTVTEGLSGHIQSGQRTMDRLGIIRQ